MTRTDRARAHKFAIVRNFHDLGQVRELRKIISILIDLFVLHALSNTLCCT